MEVIRSEHAGACYGVQRAISLALDAVHAGQKTTSLGPLIHNPQVVAQLEKDGIHSADSSDQIVDGSVLIRSHGVPPDVKATLEARGLDVIDATCPYVKKAQNAAAELARTYKTVIVVGAEGHPEVEGLRAYARAGGADVLVVGDARDLPICLPREVGVVVQTTQTNEALESVINELSAREISVDVQNTICVATEERQRAAASLAKTVDSMIVIGGFNSANTTHLAEICALNCENTHHIETADDIDTAWFAGCETVGVTAGASTPDSFIDSVIDVLRGL